MPTKQPAPTAQAIDRAPHQMSPDISGYASPAATHEVSRDAQASVADATADAMHVKATVLVDRLRMDQVADCWKRIGVRGDRSCPVLREVIHCRNCQVFATAAAALLDRPLPAADLIAGAHDPATAAAAIGSSAAPESNSRSASLLTSPAGSPTANERDHTAIKRSYLIFCVEDEWLGFPTAEFRQVAEFRGMHTLPHRRHEALLGLVNVRGALTLFIDLARLLGIPRTTHDGDAPSTNRGANDGVLRTATRERQNWASRLLVIGQRQQAAAFAVRAVGGVHRVTQAECLPVPATIRSPRQPGSSTNTSDGRDGRDTFTRGIVSWQGHSVGLLDADAVFAALGRSLM